MLPSTAGTTTAKPLIDHIRLTSTSKHFPQPHQPSMPRLPSRPRLTISPSFNPFLTTFVRPRLPLKVRLLRLSQPREHRFLRPGPPQCHRLWWRPRLTLHPPGQHGDRGQGFVLEARQCKGSASDRSYSLSRCRNQGDCLSRVSSLLCCPPLRRTRLLRAVALSALLPTRHGPCDEPTLALAPTLTLAPLF